MARRKLEDGLVDEALALCEQGMSPQEASKHLEGAGKKIAWRTIHRARERRRTGGLPKGQAAGARGSANPANGSAATSHHGPTEKEGAADARSPEPGGAAYGPPLKQDQLEQLCRVAAFLPLEQQDALLARLPIDRLRREAIARALAKFPEAVQAVAREFKAVEASLR